MADCCDTFELDRRWEEDLLYLKNIAQGFGIKVVSGRKFWESIAEFCVTKGGDPTRRDVWHHGEMNFWEMRLPNKFDGYFRKLIYWSKISNTTRDVEKWVEETYLPKLMEDFAGFGDWDLDAKEPWEHLDKSLIRQKEDPEGAPAPGSGIQVADFDNKKTATVNARNEKGNRSS